MVYNCAVSLRYIEGKSIGAVIEVDDLVRMINSELLGQHQLAECAPLGLPASELIFDVRATAKNKAINSTDRSNMAPSSHLWLRCLSGRGEAKFRRHSLCSQVGPRSSGRL